ncbi:exodeoxyribonuclease V subunit beta [Shewanella algae]|uniref:exodeoxyribonuclease V subunit beta n=1 Tax=Shewanella algae TaxID=38313 RepID=UPI00313E80FE
MQALEPLSLPLSGRRLIEASAGTGKTYTISGLYLRLLLGDFERPGLGCEQILVVTFTNAATEELRDRIRKRIRSCYQRFIGLSVKDDFIEQLYQRCPPTQRATALKQLDLALKSLDEAAIFTIHGFCQRILSDMAFESALLFESEFTLDDSEYLRQSVRDFWRHVCYRLPTALATAIAAHYATPDALGRELRPLLGASQASANRDPGKFDQYAEQLQTQLARLRLSWPRERDATEALLHSLPLNGTSYGKQADGYPKLTAMLEQMDNWAKYHQGLPPPKLLDSLALGSLKLRKGGEIPTAQQAPLLAQIEALRDSVDSLIPAFLYQARAQIAERFAELKAERNLLSPDDLLLTLAKAIGGLTQTAPDSGLAIGEQLKQEIGKRFPVALIDEFQDTDPLQFAIFSGIYPAQLPEQDADAGAQPEPKPEPDPKPESSRTLLMIGDPKQAIYAFRGADIYTYIEARRNTADHYNLDTNYRSASNMIAAVNRLFAGRNDPFISDAIPFEPVKAKDAGSKQLLAPGADSAALQLRLLKEDPDKGLNKTQARKLLAEDVAAEIVRLLNAASRGECRLTGSEQPLRARDIAILVRDKNEAAVMQQALNNRQIGAVFLSRDSVMGTEEAREIALILKALASPRDERAIRSALACRLLGFSANKIHEFNQSETLRAEVLDTFMSLHELWSRRGIMPALLNLADHWQLLERLGREANAERRLTDFRHLAELLQQKSTELEGMSALVNWFEQELLSGQSREEQQLRLASEQNLVQIVTIHKSKGLEYPVCFIPFVSLARDGSRRPSPMLYHKDNQLVWDLDASDEGWEACKRETLAEDLRLLYVALTRPVYRCYLGLANHCRMNKTGINSFLKDTAIGYLLGIEDKDCDGDRLQSAAASLVCEAISLTEIGDADPSRLQGTESHSQSPLCAQVPAMRQGAPWRVGSYSGLVKHLPHERVLPGAGDEEFEIEPASVYEPQDVLQANRFSFERGANAGSFMHLVLEKIDFTQAEEELLLHLPQAMQQYGIDSDWQDVLFDWYRDLLNADIALPQGQSMRLGDLSKRQKLVEMEFYLPLGGDTRLIDTELSRLLAKHGYGGELRFDAFKGMLKGFIDLTFEYQGRFYIADYKSNHLGDDFSDYRQDKMAAAISEHRYDLQYLLYSLALHRYLSLKLPDYCYQNHFGGCCYLFLRGMSEAHPGAGVFVDRPDEAVILALDALLKGESPSSAPQLELSL